MCRRGEAVGGIERVCVGDGGWKVWDVKITTNVE